MTKLTDQDTSQSNKTNPFDHLMPQSVYYQQCYDAAKWLLTAPWRSGAEGWRDVVEHPFKGHFAGTNSAGGLTCPLGGALCAIHPDEVLQSGHCLSRPYSAPASDRITAGWPDHPLRQSVASLIIQVADQRHLCSPTGNHDTIPQEDEFLRECMRGNVSLEDFASIPKPDNSLGR